MSLDLNPITLDCKLYMNLFNHKKTKETAPTAIKTLLFLLFSFANSLCLIAQVQKVEVQKTETGYQFLRNGIPYYVKGAGGETHLDLLLSIGGNSIRTWGIDNAQEILDIAHSKGITVMLGFWIQHERHGFDYNNELKVQNQIDYYKKAIDKFKNHPALLMWGIGNEVDLFYTNPKVWNTIQSIAKYAHEVDPNHPTSTVTAGLDSLEVAHVLSKCPDIDVYCVNTYGDIGNVPENIYKFGWKGPFMITEWGPNGHWESPTTNWGAAIEQTSTEKADVYLNRYRKYIESYKNRCLGSYVFLWGQKQEYTLTWYGLFTKEGQQTEAIDAINIAWSNKNPNLPTPTIDSFTINSKKPNQNLMLKANSKNNLANLFWRVKCYDSQMSNPKDSKIYWKILKESNDKKAGGDQENEAEEISFAYKINSKGTINFTAPNEPGNYRLFVTFKHLDKVAYANFPFSVVPNPERGNGKKIWVKKWEMESFNN